MRRPTRNDVARLAGVSGCTVSHVLNGSSDRPVSETTRANVLAAVETLGYVPHTTARALVTGRTHVISLWTGEFDPYYATLVTNLQRHLTKMGYRIMVSDVKNSSADGCPWLGSVDGIIAVECPDDTDTLLTFIPRFDIPIVGLGHHFLKQMDHVGFDLYDVSREAVEHLLDQECKRVAFAHMEWRDAPDSRLQAYQDVMAEAGRKPEVIIFEQGGRAHVRSEIKTYVAEHGCPDGIFCHNDDEALGVYRGLCDLDIRVPDDVALIGCDGLSELEYMEHPITTIKIPLEDMCRVAWEFLERRISDRSTPLQETIFEPELIVRESSLRKSSAGDTTNISNKELARV